MVETDNSEFNFSSEIDSSPYNAIGIGVGLGKAPETIQALEQLLKKMKNPAVFDADALNILSENRALFQLIPEKSIFTPHPKELERLIGQTKNSYDRLNQSILFAATYKVYIVLKGANTVTISPEGNCYFNSTGNPGMATAGSGDVLCGMITGLLAQQYSPEEAAVLAVYFHGKAGDAAAGKRSQAGIIASDIIEEIQLKNKL